MAVSEDTAALVAAQLVAAHLDFIALGQGPTPMESLALDADKIKQTLLGLYRGYRDELENEPAKLSDPQLRAL